MAVKNLAAAAFAAFAAVAVCWAGGLAPTSGGYVASSSDRSSSSASTTTLGSEEDVVSFSFEDEMPDEIGGYEVLSEFLPDGVALEWTGKKLKAPKSGKIKYNKKEEAFVDTKDSDNPAGLSVKYNKKSSTVSGSFKVYVAKSEKKLKSYKAKFSGKLGKSMGVFVKGKRVATAVIE